jgi:hypothetical protein
MSAVHETDLTEHESAAPTEIGGPDLAHANAGPTPPVQEALMALARLLGRQAAIEMIVGTSFTPTIHKGAPQS